MSREPPNADMLQLTGFTYCPHCAARALAPLGQKAACCTACGFRYFHNPAAAVVGLIERNSDILFIQRAQEPGRGLLGLPGGFVDYGETLEQALGREIQEETGLTARHLEYFGSTFNEYLYGEITYLSTDAYYVCSVDHECSLRCGDEVAAASWRSPESVQSEGLAFPGVARMLSLYVQKQRQNGSQPE
jgi:NAD+ diphosphatase